jgi:SAM-dependent methyltransferase
MDLTGWNARYREAEVDETPTPLLVKVAGSLTPGRALDLASGAGRNALWLAHRGWKVTAVDGAEEAIEILRRRAGEEQLPVEAILADLERGEYRIEPEAWDLIVMCHYLQRDLLESAKQGVVPGGVVLAIVHTVDAGETPSATRAARGELRGYFADWHILHDYEGSAPDPANRPVAEIAARRPETEPRP